MLVVLSPAKKLDFDSENHTESGDQPQFLSQSKKLIKTAKTLKAGDLRSLMGISEALAELNVKRFKAFKAPFTTSNARSAIDAFQGDVYVGLEASSLNDEDRAFANEHVRILSGLYGLLKPLDLMQAYRLEMGIKFKNERGKNLYEFWDDRLAKALDKELKQHDSKVLINLASNEYFKAVKPKSLNASIITPVFQEVKDGRARVISFLAKKARGTMTRYIIDNRIDTPDTLKKFNEGGYRYSEADSSDDRLIFKRPQP
ncbi:peroxide stress protein YaaA [Kordiimonas aquimaris]|uniref:peroxide stress protein YaaA n=1 Tax=Kordiimonas aquimaris TaxID=707591 RepID=UPI0021CF34E1|nr:peroxide stress protein YaaA [Kordiimonas aquimaris]